MRADTSSIDCRAARSELHAPDDIAYTVLVDLSVVIFILKVVLTYPDERECRRERLLGESSNVIRDHDQRQ